MFITRKIVGLFTLSLAFNLASCEKPTSREIMKTENHAGKSEPTFAEAYAPSLQLPVPTSEFEDRLKKLGLQYEILRGDNANSAFPLPSKDSGLDPKNLLGCIKIYGTKDQQNRSMQMFRAYEDRNSEIVYIENAYAYTGP